MAVSMAETRKTIDPQRLLSLTQSLREIKELTENVLRTEEQVQRLANQFFMKKHVFFAGRGLDYALSMEAALKLKEVSYIFSEDYAAGELKHGPLALMQEGCLVMASVTQPELLEKSLSNLQEITARGAYVVAVTSNLLADRVAAHVNQAIRIPDCDPLVAPLLAAIPMQLFAYYMALERGCDVDQPRNLAKSVTV